MLHVKWLRNIFSCFVMLYPLTQASEISAWEGAKWDSSGYIQVNSMLQHALWKSFFIDCMYLVSFSQQPHLHPPCDGQFVPLSFWVNTLWFADATVTVLKAGLVSSCGLEIILLMTYSWMTLLSLPVLIYKSIKSSQDTDNVHHHQNIPAWQSLFFPDCSHKVLWNCSTDLALTDKMESLQGENSSNSF